MQSTAFDNKHVLSTQNNSASLASSSFVPRNGCQNKFSASGEALPPPSRGVPPKPCHRLIHWLDVSDHVTYRLCVHVYKSQHGLASQCLSDLCQPVIWLFPLCSSWSARCVSVSADKLYSGCSIICAAAMWNSLPDSLKDTALLLSCFQNLCWNVLRKNVFRHFSSLVLLTHSVR